MAINHVEVDQVYERQTVIVLRPQRIDPLHPGAIGFCGVRFTNAFAREDVVNLADGANWIPRILDRIQDRAGRFQRVVMSPARSPKIAGFTLEWPRDHTPDPIGIGFAPCDFTNLVEPVYWNNRLVRGNLENRIRRGIKDWFARREMFRAQFLEHGGSTTRVVADKLDARFLFNCSHDRVREFLEN